MAGSYLTGQQGTPEAVRAHSVVRSTRHQQTLRCITQQMLMLSAALDVSVAQVSPLSSHIHACPELLLVVLLMNACF